MFESKEVKADAAALEEKLNKSWDLWDAGDRSKFDNVEFVERLEDWYNRNNPKTTFSGKNKKVSDYVHYKREIIEDFGAMKLAKLRDDEGEDYSGAFESAAVKASSVAKILNSIDIDNELLLWLTWDSGDDTGFIITNKQFIYSLRGEQLTDIMPRVGSVEWAKLHSVEIERGGILPVYDLSINGEKFGRFTFGGLKKERQYIMDLLSAIAGLTAELFKEPTIVTVASGTNDNLPDPLEQLEKLKSLLDAGVISEEEFTSKKEDLLNKI